MRRLLFKRLAHGPLTEAAPLKDEAAMKELAAQLAESDAADDGYRLILSRDQILDTMNSLTSMFFLVMTAISSVALLVGGIGVMAIMMVSVTDRTREIGLRMACGATRKEILWQFLVEAATLTLIGGLAGILFGLTMGEVVKRVLGLEAGVPLWSAVVATMVSIGIGLIFGLLPANRAARMDPVEALRHE